MRLKLVNTQFFKDSTKKIIKNTVDLEKKGIFDNVVGEKFFSFDYTPINKKNYLAFKAFPTVIDVSGVLATFLIALYRTDEKKALMPFTVIPVLRNKNMEWQGEAKTEKISFFLTCATYKNYIAHPALLYYNKGLEPYQDRFIESNYVIEEYEKS